MASVHTRRGELAEAEEAFDRAQALAELAGARHTEAAILIGRAESCLLDGRLAEADAHGRSALANARGEGYRIIEGQALTVLGRVRLAGGRPDEAAGLATQAAAVLEETGHRLGLSGAHEVLSRARRQASVDHGQDRDRGAGGTEPPG